MMDNRDEWYNRIDAVRIGNEDTTRTGRTAAYNYGFDKKYVGFSSAKKITLAPQEIGWELVLRLVKDRTTARINGTNLMMIDCAERYDYEDLYFMVDGLWVQLNAEDYIYELENECVLGIMAHDIEYWVMGSAWLQGYYTQFDN